MGRFRKLVEKGFEKLDEHNERSQERAVAKLSPAEREHYDMWEARTEAARAGATDAELGDARLTAKVLQGPAGEVVHGIRKAPKGAPEIEDPAAWEEQALRERAARDEARAPYVSPERSPVRITRVGATDGSQLAEVCAYLGRSGLAARPDLVYGATRVPDMIGGGGIKPFGSRYVEWDVLHAAERELAPADPAAAVTLRGDRPYVARAVGQRSPLDEDVALDVLGRAGIEPARTLGISRVVRFEGRGGEGDSSTPRRLALISGADILVPGDPATADALRRAAEAPAPWQLPEEPPPPNRIDVLQWDALAVAVHPVRQRRAPMPSPFPYLPLTPTELLRAHLEIVGIAPADCYSVAVTYDRPFDLMGRTSTKWGVRRTGGGPDFPCADGKPRQRMAGGHRIVVTYRDRPAYAAGRERFEAYSREVLFAHLDRMLNLRPPVPKPTGKLARAVDFADEVRLFFSDDAGTDNEIFPPRYCWPPTER